MIDEKSYKPSSEPFRVFPKSFEDEIIISGVSGRFPNCDNVQEFRDHLYNKVGGLLTQIRICFLPILFIRIGVVSKDFFEFGKICC